MILRVFICLFIFTAVACKSGSDNKLSEAEKQKFEQLIEEGKGLAQSKKYDEAIEVFKEALKIDSNRVEPNYGLGYALGKSCEGKEERCKESLLYYNRAIEIDPDYRNSYFNRSFTRFMLGDFDGAIKDVDEAISKKPSEADYYIFRASLYMGQQDSTKACTDLAKAIELGAKFQDDVLKNYCNK
jgi:tetratricopeptide (TPR) repeat protein